MRMKGNEELFLVTLKKHNGVISTTLRELDIKRPTFNSFREVNFLFKEKVEEIIKESKKKEKEKEETEIKKETKRGSYLLEETLTGEKIDIANLDHKDLRILQKEILTTLRTNKFNVGKTLLELKIKRDDFNEFMGDIDFLSGYNELLEEVLDEQEAFLRSSGSVTATAKYLEAYGAKRGYQKYIPKTTTKEYEAIQDKRTHALFSQNFKRKEHNENQLLKMYFDNKKASILSSLMVSLEEATTEEATTEEIVDIKREMIDKYYEEMNPFHKEIVLTKAEEAKTRSRHKKSLEYLSKIGSKVTGIEKSLDTKESC